jgi:hypothetical protein
MDGWVCGGIRKKSRNEECTKPMNSGRVGVCTMLHNFTSDLVAQYTWDRVGLILVDHMQIRMTHPTSCTKQIPAHHNLSLHKLPEHLVPD